MRRRIVIAGAWILGGTLLLIVVLGGAVLVAGNTAAGRGAIERLTYLLTGGTVKLSGLGGSFPARLTLEQLQLIDRGGIWLTADQLALTWSPLRLVERRIQIDTLQVSRVHMERAPISDGHGGKVSFPTIEVGHATLARVELGAPLVGSAVALSAQGNLRLRSLEDADSAILIRRLDGDGEYELDLRLDPTRMDAGLTVREPAGGPLENLLELPGLGALAATVTVHGPRNAEAVELALRAGDLQAKIDGTINLTQGSADLDYSLTAPAMAPRMDLAWSAVTLRGDWHGALTAPKAAGRLRIDGLQVAGSTRVATLTADLAAAAGKLDVVAAAQGLEVPGPRPRLFANDPLKMDASVQLDVPARPLEVAVTHPLFSLHGHAQTAGAPAGQLAAAAELRIPELAPFAVLTGEDVRGSALLEAQWLHQSSNDALTLNAKLDLAGGTAAWLAVAGPVVTLKLKGSLSAAMLELDSLRLAGRALTVTASGSVERAAPATDPGHPDARGFLERFAKRLQVRWQLDAADLAELAGDLAGDLHLTGTLGGPPTAMNADAELASHLSVRGSTQGSLKASLHARGLPAAPGGTLLASGMLDGAPLSVDAAVERGAAHAYHVTVRRADWKSAHVEGDLSADEALTGSHGQISMRIGQFADFDRLLGLNMSGRADGDIRIVAANGRTHAELRLDGKDLVIGPLAGSVHLEGDGVPDNFALQLSAKLPAVSGLPADVAAAATLDVAARSLELSSASLAYHGQSVELLTPARLSFATGLAVDELKVGVQEAVFELRGQLAPTLDLTASLRQVKPGLVNVFAPQLLAGGLLEAGVRLQGTASSPTGRVRLDATDIRFADDAATGLPALAVHASAQLDGNAATVAAQLDAGTASQLTASGSVPLNADGTLGIQLSGKLDVGLVNPFLEARGMHASGALKADASVTGSVSDPQVGGGITLADGSWRDYGRGLSLTNISADIGGAAGALQIKSFNAKAASGSVALTGTVGVMQPGLPLSLEIIAKNAQPIASNILTANLDADIRVNGTARQRLDVAGTIHVNRATIGIPDSLPPEVAVLDVRRRGKAVAPVTDPQLIVGIDIAIQAPRQILVQGRGLDAEMGGEIGLHGTSDSLVVSGGLDLQRGSFSIGGSKLTFSQDSKIRFDGAGLQKKIDPTLDFSAQTTVGATSATLRITGLADAPRFDFSSSPELPPDQIMALLLFGQPAAQLSALQAAEVGYALANLSGVAGGGSNPLLKLQKSLGLDRLTVGTNTVNTPTGGTENSGAAIAAGRYISNRVYIEGKQTNTGNSQVQVDVDLTKRLKLQTRLGNGTATVQGTTPDNDPGSSIGLLYQFEY